MACCPAVDLRDAPTGSSRQQQQAGVISRMWLVMACCLAVDLRGAPTGSSMTCRALVMLSGATHIHEESGMLAWASPRTCTSTHVHEGHEADSTKTGLLAGLVIWMRLMHAGVTLHWGKLFSKRVALNYYN